MNAKHHVQIARRPSEITRLAFAADPQARAVVHARGNLDAEDLFFKRAALAFARRAGFDDDLAQALTVRASSRHRKKALLASDLSAPAASRAGDGLAPLPRSPPATLRAAFPARDFDFGVEPGRRFLKRNFHVVSQVRAPFGAAAAAAPLSEDVAKTEEVPEDVLEVGEDRRGKVRRGGTHPRVPETVVDGALLRVGEHGVGFRNLLEPFRGFFGLFRIAVGMVLERQFPVCAFDFRQAGVPPHAQHRVVIPFWTQCVTPDGPAVDPPGPSSLSPAAFRLSATLTTAGRSSRWRSLYPRCNSSTISWSRWPGASTVSTA